MKERLLQLMNHLGYTATRFADEMGIQRSGISHILSGRNQPSYDFIVKVMTRFPEINIEWLLTGKGELTKSLQNELTSAKNHLVSQPDKAKQAGLFNDNVTEGNTNVKTGNETYKVTNVNKIHRIIVLYTDGTFNHYDPVGQD